MHPSPHPTGECNFTSSCTSGSSMKARALTGDRYKQELAAGSNICERLARDEQTRPLRLPQPPWWAHLAAGTWRVLFPFHILFRQRKILLVFINFKKKLNLRTHGQNFDCKEEEVCYSGKRLTGSRKKTVGSRWKSMYCSAQIKSYFLHCKTRDH